MSPSRGTGKIFRLAALGALAAWLWRRRKARPPEGDWRDLAEHDGAVSTKTS